MATTTTKVTNTPKKYAFIDLERLWIKGGGNPVVAPVMAAIALAESGGNPNALHKNKNGSVDRGLWQINSSHKYGTASMDPGENAKEAVSIYHSQGLVAWSTFTSGAYRKFLPKIDPLTRNATNQNPPRGGHNRGDTIQSGVGNIIAGNPAKGIGQIGGATGIKGAVEKLDPFSGITDAIMLGLKEGMYALAILGGGMLILLGLLFIGADIGLGGLHKTPPVRVIKSVTPNRRRSTTRIDTGTPSGGGNNLPGPEA